MANISKAIERNFINSVLPTFGNQRATVGPVWDEGQKMFIVDEYEAESGNRYYRGVRFCDRMVMVEYVGLYHNWTYIDGIELYIFDGSKLNLAQKRTYNKVFRDEDTVRRESKSMLRQYLSGIAKSQNHSINDASIDGIVDQTIADCYKSFLDDDYNVRLNQQVLPQIKKLEMRLS